LIAVMLISLCAFPLINSQISMYRIGLETAVTTMSQQLAEQTFREIQKDLYVNPEDNMLNISWDQLKEMTTDWKDAPPKFHESDGGISGELPDVMYSLVLGEKGFKTMNVTLKREYYVSALQNKPDGWFSLEYPEKHRVLDIRVNIYRKGHNKKSKGSKPFNLLSDDEKESLPQFLLMIEEK